jgi:hypothetical protein
MICGRCHHWIWPFQRKVPIAGGMWKIHYKCWRMTNR